LAGTELVMPPEKMNAFKTNAIITKGRGMKQLHGGHANGTRACYFYGTIGPLSNFSFPIK
jgi:hypothetical protein